MDDATGAVVADRVGGLTQIDAHVKGEATAIRFHAPEAPDTTARGTRAAGRRPGARQRSSRAVRLA